MYTSMHIATRYIFLANVYIWSFLKSLCRFFIEEFMLEHLRWLVDLLRPLLRTYGHEWPCRQHTTPLQ
jgi:hypothetical protein